MMVVVFSNTGSDGGGVFFKMRCDGGGGVFINKKCDGSGVFFQVVSDGCGVCSPRKGVVVVVFSKKNRLVGRVCPRRRVSDGCGVFSNTRQ